MLLVVAAVYLPTLGFPLVYDDGWVLSSNGFIRHVGDLPLLFSRRAVQANVPDAFRPTLVVFDTLAYGLLGLRPVFHHAVSVGLHLAVCLSFAHYLEKLGAPLALRLGTVGIFGVMAVHAEAVAVISFREDLLAAWLGLLALNLAQRCADGQVGASWLVVVVALCALASGAKMSVATLPWVWIVARRYGPWRRVPPVHDRSLLVAGALVCGVALAVGHRCYLYGGLSPYGESAHVLSNTVGLAPVLARSVQIHLTYLQQLVVPFRLSPEYVDRAAGWAEVATWLAASSLGLLFAYGVFCLRSDRRRLTGFSVVAAFILALPTSNLFPLPNMQADRFLYLSSAPVALGLAAAALHAGRWVARGRSYSGWIVAPLVGFGVVQGAVAYATAATYANNATLWQVASRRAPLSARARAMVGIQRIIATGDREILDAKVTALARADCRRARQLDPQEELAHICLGRVAIAQRRWSVAHGHYEQALRRTPRRTDLVLGSLTQLSLDLPSDDPRDRYTLAAEYASRGMREYPYSADMLAAAARAFHRTGHPYTALVLYRGARSMRPERWETVAAAVELMLDLGHIPTAQRTFWEQRDVLRSAPDSRYRAIAARLRHAQDFSSDSVIEPLLVPGVFPP